MFPEKKDSGDIPIIKAGYYPSLKDKPRRLMFSIKMKLWFFVAFFV